MSAHLVMVQLYHFFYSSRSSKKGWKSCCKLGGSAGRGYASLVWRKTWMKRWWVFLLWMQVQPCDNRNTSTWSFNWLSSWWLQIDTQGDNLSKNSDMLRNTLVLVWTDFRAVHPHTIIDMRGFTWYPSTPQRADHRSWDQITELPGGCSSVSHSKHVCLNCSAC